MVDNPGTALPGAVAASPAPIRIAVAAGLIRIEHSPQFQPGKFTLDKPLPNIYAIASIGNQYFPGQNIRGRLRHRDSLPRPGNDKRVAA